MYANVPVEGLSGEQKTSGDLLSPVLLLSGDFSRFVSLSLSLTGNIDSIEETQICRAIRHPSLLSIQFFKQGAFKPRSPVIQNIIGSSLDYLSPFNVLRILVTALGFGLCVTQMSKLPDIPSSMGSWVNRLNCSIFFYFLRV